MVEIAKTLDAKGLNCPMPILKTKKAIEDVEVGTVLEVLSTDPGSVSDFNAWTKSTGHEIVESEEKDGVFRYLIKRTK